MTQETYSYINMLLLTGLGSLVTCCAALLGYWASYVNKRMAEQTECLGELNTSVTKLQSWSEAHDKQDDDRHEENKSDLKGITETLHGIERGPARGISAAPGRRRRGES